MPNNITMCFLYAVHGQREEFKCPDDYGFYPHSLSCDKYWKCDNNVAELKTCGNGLAFDDTDPKYLKENCDYLHNVDCGARTQLGKTRDIIYTDKLTTGRLLPRFFFF